MSAARQKIRMEFTTDGLANDFVTRGFTARLRNRPPRETVTIRTRVTTRSMTAASGSSNSAPASDQPSTSAGNPSSTGSYSFLGASPPQGAVTDSSDSDSDSDDSGSSDGPMESVQFVRPVAPPFLVQRGNPWSKGTIMLINRDGIL